ncbi:Eaa1 [Klebsiella pneumoniae]|nr:Eaa1 [Klebsiella pneumoniae]
MKFEEWLSQQNGVIEVDCGCVTSEAFYHWMRVAYEAGNSQVIPDGWTCNDKANAALMMLDRIETVDPVDDDRIDSIKRIVRELAAAPQSPGSDPATVPGKWIPVSERMPENDVSVLTFDGMYKRVHHAMYGHWQCWEPEKITHWMPLPAASQEVKGE